MQSYLYLQNITLNGSEKLEALPYAIHIGEIFQKELFDKKISLQFLARPTFI